MKKRKLKKDLEEEIVTLTMLASNREKEIIALQKDIITLKTVSQSFNHTLAMSTMKRLSEITHDALEAVKLIKEVRRNL